jgi:putative lipoic acid-binding regulatory protein
MDPANNYENFRSKLDKHHNWPMVYMFKFIIPTDNNKLALVQSKFSDTSVINTKESANGNYTSITVRETMMSAEEIINKYKELEGIEGLISL